jgi:hypothetical protein
MLARTKDAYDEAWRTLEIAKKAETEMNIVARNAKPMRAEIDENSTAGWYLAQTVAGDERRALRHLARHRFAGYLAMAPKRHDEGFGAERTTPGWLLVYVFDIDKMLDRLCASPGIQGVLHDPRTGRPMAVDENFIHTAIGENARVRFRQPVQVPEANPQKAKKPRKPNKYERKALDRLKEEMKAKTMTYNEAQWEVISKLEPHIRIAVLEQTLRPLTVSISGSGA